jgi:hypothetical protein
VSVTLKNSLGPANLPLTQTYLFLPSASLNILLMPWTRPPSDGAFAPVDIPYYAAVPRIAQQLQRMWPVAAGVSSLNTDGLHPSSAGLKYGFGSIFFCPDGLKATGDRTSSCDALARAQGQEELDYYNAAASTAQKLDGLTRDRLYVGSVLTVEHQLFGGQSCWFDLHEHVAGADTSSTIDDNSAFIVAQEISHCLGLVAGTSPNSIGPLNPPHSKNNPVQVGFFRNTGEMDNPLTGQAFGDGQVRSVMYPYFNVIGCGVPDKNGSCTQTAFEDDNVNDVIMEGYEWNQLRSDLAAGKFQAPVPGNTTPAGSLLDIDMRLGFDDSAAIDYAGLSTIDNLPITPNAPASPYAVQFLDFSGAPISTLQVALSLANTEHGNEPSINATSAALHIPVPTGAMGWRLVKLQSAIGSMTTILQGSLPQNPPTIAPPTATLDDVHRVVHLTWGSGAPYVRIFYNRGVGQLPLLTATGLHGTSYDVPIDSLQPSGAGTFTVVASSGGATQQLQSPPLTIDPAVIVKIVSPQDNASFRAGTTETLSAVAVQGGVILNGNSLVWSEELTTTTMGLGTGSPLIEVLAPGKHHIKLLAIGTDGQQAQAEVTVDVVSPTIQCTGCYFVTGSVRAALAFQIVSPGSGSTFSYNYRSAMQTVQFMSTTTSQITLSGNSAIFSGSGKLNGQPGYSFSVTATDGGPAGSGLDTVSIAITGPNNYSYTVTSAIVGGDVVIHQ